MTEFVLCEENFGWIDVWKLNPEGLGSLGLKAFATWGGGRRQFGLKVSMTRSSWAVLL
jgi:hypothetical protein